MRVFRNGRAILAESPVWDAPSETLLWCDITAGLVHRSSVDGPPEGSRDLICRLDAPVASFQPVASGGFVVALEERVVIVDDLFNIRSELARVEHAHPGMRLNEGKCDPFGRFVVGSMDVTRGEPDAALYRLSADGRSEVLLGGIAVANGFEWSDDGSEFFFTDTSVSTVYRCGYGPGDQIGEPEPFLTGAPSDGFARDSSGGFWSGCYGQGRVIRRDEDGRLLSEVAIPAPNVTGLAFGGPELSTLYVCTAREKLDERALERYPQSGGVFAIDTDVRGYPTHAFGGGPPAPHAG